MKFIGISNIWYGTVFGSDDLDSGALTGAKVNAWLKKTTTKEVKNSHDGTWGYSQDDPSVEDYINELTGKPYHRDMTSEGNKTISFTMGVYEFTDKAELQGGKADDDHWEGGNIELVYKGIVAKTKTGNYIVFTNASITAKTDQQNKALGLGVTAVAMESETDGLKDEYLFKGSTVDSAKA